MQVYKLLKYLNKLGLPRALRPWFLRFHSDSRVLGPMVEFRNPGEKRCPQGKKVASVWCHLWH